MDYKKWFPYLPLFKAFRCSYCGGVSDSHDHTPPNCLLPKPTPLQVRLMTIPACKTCNRSFSDDENLLKAIILTVSFNPADIQESNENGWLFQKKRRDKKLRDFIDSRLTEDGIFLLDQNAFDVIARIATKTTVGLLLYEFGRVVSMADVCVVGLEHTKNYDPTAFAEIHRRDDGLCPEITSSGRELERQVQAMFGIPSKNTAKWKIFIPDYFEYLFMERSNGKLLTGLNFHNAITILLECPWPSMAGPNRKKRKLMPGSV